MEGLFGSRPQWFRQKNDVSVFPAQRSQLRIHVVSEGSPKLEDLIERDVAVVSGLSSSLGFL